MAVDLLPNKHRSKQEFGIVSILTKQSLSVKRVAIALVLLFLLAIQFIAIGPLALEYSFSAMYLESNGTTVANTNTTKMTAEITTTNATTTNVKFNGMTVPKNLSNASITNRKPTMTIATKAINASLEHEHTQNIGVATHNSSDIDKNIVIQMRFPRPDRLGSHIRRPLLLMGYTNCYRQTFCIKKGSEGLARHFSGFDSCPDNLHTRLDWGDIGWKDEKQMFQGIIERPGVYAFKRGDTYLGNWFKENEDCAFDDAMRQKWGKMIVNASYSVENQTLGKEELFERTDDQNVVTLAINIRRGDLVDWGGRLFPDQVYVVMLRQLRSILKKAGKAPEVHLFSEDYGLVDKALNITRNWTMYDGLVEHFHLVGDMRTNKNKHAMNVDLNLRDWRHFVKADILVVGGSFSYIPSLGRPRHPDPTTGLPLTIDIFTSPDKDGSKTKYHAFQASGNLPDKGYALVNLPEVFAKHDTIPVKVFFEDLLADFKAKYTPLWG